MKQQYGEFSRQGDEYIIYRPDTPQAWPNFLVNDVVTSRLSPTGEGHIARSIKSYQSSPPNPVLQRRHFYIRDADSGQWWRLAESSGKIQRFEVVHGLSYSRLQSTSHEIDSAITFFLPPGEPCEIWQVKVRNAGQVKRRLNFFAVVEWPYTDIDQFQAEFRDGYLLKIDRTTTDLPLRADFLGSDHALDSFDLLESAFLGSKGNYAEPAALRDGRCSRSVGSGSSPIGAWQKNLVLGAGGEIDFSLFVGSVVGTGKTPPLAQRSAHEQIRRIVRKYSQPQAVSNAFQATKQTVDELVSRNLVKTPDTVFDYFYNYWLSQRMWFSVRDDGDARVAFDQIPTLAAHNPDSARQVLLAMLSKQHRDGQIQDNSHHDVSQELVWGLIGYLKETADLAFLDQQVPYIDAGEGSVLQHVVRAMDFATGHLSRRYLPLTKLTTNVEKDEAVEELVRASRTYANLRSLAPILDAIGEHELVNKYERLGSKLREAINEHFWDGSWYGSQIVNGKHQVGFKRSDYHKIGLIEQAWAVIAGVASSERGKKAFAAVQSHLATKYGLASLWPSYPHRVDSERSLESPGAGYNGAILAEENALAVVATAQLGDGDASYKIWQLSCPAYLGIRPEQYQGAPYAYAEFIYGPSHPLFGRASNRLSQNAAGLMWQAMAESILGIQPVLGGLKIDPCLPRDWRQVEVTRQFRGAEYHIRILNSFRQNRGVDRILVNGVRITGHVVPPQGAGIHFVEVVLG